jgi:FkbM family methyltransferase
VSRILYHALRGRYSLARRLGALTQGEYDETKRLLKQRFYAAPKGAASLYVDGRGFRQEFAGYFDENRDLLHEKYLRLVDGLDDESRGVVSGAVSRLMDLHRMDKIYRVDRASGRIAFRMTHAEELAAGRLDEEFHSKVIGFPNGVWAYKNWLLPHQHVFAEAVLHRHFAEELAGKQKIRAGDIIDVGGFTGDSALALSGYTDKKVYSFEPSRMNIEKMRETIRLNGAAGIVPVQLGLGDREETLLMPEDGAYGSKTFSGRGEPVRVTTLDEWARGSGADVGLIKVDIEGYEQKFLRGAVGTIKRHRPAMLLSMYHNASDFFEIKPWVEGLGLGYRFKVRRPAGTVVGDTTLICEAT